jgi:phosphoribosylglycinamide formyltransferase-1
MTLRLGWFSTGRDQEATNILSRIHDAIREGTLDAAVEYVFCNRERGEHEASDRFLDFVAQRGLPLLCKSSAGFQPELRRQDRPRWRALYDREVLELISPFAVDLCVLAGYMLVVSDVLHGHYIMLNLHPAKPDGPTGSWEDVIWRIIADGQDEAGAMIHVAAADLDRGPVVAYCTFPIRGGAFDPLWDDMAAKLRGATLEETRAREGHAEPLFAAIRAAEFKREVPLLLATLLMVARGRVAFRDGAVLVDGGPAENGLCVNEWVEKQLAGEQP